ncbi:MAG: hypothetical protein GX963_14930 [Bacteroidales bacterium]|nr:hypothetical protein [Bacteroidales bacterium]
MKQKIKFEDTVFIFDTSFYNFIVADIKKYFESSLNRELSPIDLPSLITYLALDMGIQVGDNTTQLLWVFDKTTPELFFTFPSDLKQDLDGKAFQNELGEFLMASVTTENIVSIGELYVEIVQMALESEEVKKIALIADYKSYGDLLSKLFNTTVVEEKEKEVILFDMGDVNQHKGVKNEILAYPLMQALGIKSDDLED